MIKNSKSKNTYKSATNPENTLNRRFCVAPMLDWTDRHYRYFARLISKQAILYSEMITTGALIYGDRDKYLDFHQDEQPVALQLGGSNIQDLAQCAKFAEDWGYREVNLNVGCPSDRVQNNMIGACLMAHPELVRDCLSAMIDACSIDVTVKHRIGIDELDSYDHLSRFVSIVAESGCKVFIVHARKAILQGLSPKENREIPPLQYDTVYRLKQDFPELTFIINGGIKTIPECQQHLQNVDGVMVGREAYQNPWLLSYVDEDLYGTAGITQSRIDVLKAMFPYIESQLAEGHYLGHMTRHILGLFHGQAGGRVFRRLLSEKAYKPGAGMEVMQEALDTMQYHAEKARQRLEQANAL